MKRYYILVIVVFGFLMIPITSNACGIKSQDKCYNKDNDIKHHHNDCCEKTKNSKEKSRDNCGKKCNSSSCRCTTSSTTAFIAFDTTSNPIFLIFFSNKKINYYIDTLISDGFYSVWHPPKIS